MGKYRIEIIGSGSKDSINIEGCKNVEKYTSEEISVSLHDRIFTVMGKNLTMPVLVNENLCINGFVKKMEITPKKEGKTDK